MAINKKLIHFNKREDFDKKSKATSANDTTVDILYSSIVFIKDTQEIWTHGKIYPAPYTKEELDAFLADKADVSTLNQYYNKTEVDTKIANAVTDSIDLSIYETIEGATSKYQPKGNYLTEHQDISGKVDKVTGKSLVADTEITKLEDLPNNTQLTNLINTAKAAGDNAQSDLNAHKQNKSNPHEVTKAQVGLGNVTNDAQVKRSELGVANGVATLDADGKVPASQLPSYVDDIIDVYATYSKSDTGVLSNVTLYLDAAHTQLVTGEAGKIYQNIADGEPQYQFRWTGTIFSQTGASSLILGEVTGTAYDGAKGKANADNIAKINDILYDTMDVGNAVLVNRRTLEKVSVPPYQLNKYAPEEWEPIGVVVIPTSHDVYGTGEAGVMALKSASLTTPDIGQTSNADIAWGAYGTDYPELNNFNQANTLSVNNEDYVLGYTAYPYLPSDNFYGNLSLDSIARYIGNPNAPSPYNADGSRNPLYFATGAIEPTPPIYGEGVLATTPGLNVSWETQTGVWNEEQNDDSYDGKQFKSVSPGSSGSTVIRCKFSGIAGKITFKCKYDGENDYDYLTIGNLDTICTRTSYRDSLKGVAGVWSEVEFNIPDTNEHYVEFCYSKDISGDTAPDCATVFILSEKREVLQFGLSGAGTTANALSDFAGKSNTEFLCSKATKQENWRTDDTITNNYNAGYHPAACACWRFHTVGTSQGDWYLPACGELGYCVVRYKLINETIAVLQAWSGKTYCSLAQKYFWSSSVYNPDYTSNYARTVLFNTGEVYYDSRNASCYVRPFLRLSLNKNLSFYTRPEVDKRLVPLEEASNRSLITFVVQDSDTNVESDITIYGNGTHTVHDREEYTYYDYGYNNVDLYGQWDIDET